MPTFHPRKNDDGNLVEILQPSQPSAMGAWDDPNQIATATPGSPTPVTVLGIAVSAWTDAPTELSAWEWLIAATHFEEPTFTPLAEKKPASGAVVLEPDGRVWVVSPSNRYGGYINTYPKGKVDATTPVKLRANAIKEVFEESGLQVELTGFLCDSVRSTSVTRYYMALRIGGSPANMGWESQAVSLVPQSKLGQFASHANDEIVVRSLRDRLCLSTSDIVSYQWGLSSVHRILAAVAGFRRQYGHWPKRILVDRGMVEAIPMHILTPLGWELLNQKLEIVTIDEGEVFAEGSAGERFQYGDHFPLMQEGPPVSFWIWGVDLLGQWSQTASLATAQSSPHGLT